ncbi:MAG: 3'(2'),5'-bisphosphate nucleotidase CysQ [Verrucomicrobiota bacterium]
MKDDPGFLLDPNRMLASLLALSHRAGLAILEHFGQDLPADKKADDSPLTLGDLASHRCIVEGLKAEYPDIPIVSEENPEAIDVSQAERYWMVDPLDGTKEFIKKTGYFTVNIALIEDHCPILGVIHVPVHGTTYYADPTGAWKQEKDAEAIPIQTAPCPPPTTESPLRLVASRDHAGPAVEALLQRYPKAECLSIGSSLKFCLVAEGKADAYLRDIPTMEWDTGAAQAIVSAAGGAVQTWPDLRELRYGKPEFRNGALLTVGRREIAQALAGGE